MERQTGRQTREAASTAAKHFEKLDTVLGDFEIERNRLRNKGK
jgi:hypothetical protein